MDLKGGNSPTPVVEHGHTAICVLGLYFSLSLDYAFPQRTGGRSKMSVEERVAWMEELWASFYRDGLEILYAS